MHLYLSAAHLQKPTTFQNHDNDNQQITSLRIAKSITPGETIIRLINLTLAVHERVDSRFLVLAGSESIFTEIAEFHLKYFSPSKPIREFKYESE